MKRHLPDVMRLSEFTRECYPTLHCIKGGSHCSSGITTEHGPRLVIFGFEKNVYEGFRVIVRRQDAQKTT